MINKLFKTILIFSLSFLISIPTNAAVSVSDGSAFVTKAESSASLNNLSNRMAQLENSLDAKIDSLVSAYLTRNGIWNGAKQTLIRNQCQSYYTFTNSYGWLRSWFVHQDQSITPQNSITNSSQYQRPSTKNITSRTAFSEALTKSGLLYCRFDVLAYRSSMMRVIPQTTTSGGGIYMQSMNGYYSDLMKITDQTNELKYRDDFSIGFTIAGNYYLPEYNDKIVFFFVSKGDVLYFETDANMSFSNICSDTNVENFGRKWIFKDLSIY